MDGLSDDKNHLLGKSEIDNIITEYFQQYNAQYEMKDFSKGCDNLVFLVKTKNESIIIKIPKKDEKKRPPSHSPFHLQWCLQQCTQANVRAPKSLLSNEKFHIEEYIGEKDLGEISKELSKEEILQIYQQVGVELKKIHSIKTNSFSYMSSIPGVGSKENFYLHFENEVMNNAKFVHEKNKELLNEDHLKLISSLLNRYKEYLIEFSDPRLLHSDITFNNIRVEKINGKYEFNSIIDFSDCCSGDPIYDFGEIFEDTNCNWEFVTSLEIGYEKKFNDFEKELIVFYAMTYSIWLEHKENLHYCLNYLK